MPTYTYTTDFGAVGDGTTDNTAATALWIAAATANPGSTLIVPGTGLYLPGTVDGSHPGMATLQVDATIIAPAGAATYITYVGPPACFPGDMSLSAFIADAHTGDTHVTLLSGGDASKFFVGQWIAVTGLELMPAGYPSSFQRNEWRQISAISGTTISFSSPLTQGYSAGWPNLTLWNTSNNFGGAAMIAGTAAGWNCSVVLDGFTIHGSGGNCTGRAPIIRNCSWVDGGCIALSPTACVSALFENCNIGDSSTGSEIDKIIDTVEYRNCTGSGVFCQSAGVNHLIVSGGTNFGFVSGLVRQTTFNNATLYNLQTGSGGYGRCDRMSVTALTINGAYSCALGYIQKSYLTWMGGGVYRAPINAGAGHIYAAAVPGYTYAYCGNPGGGGVFVTKDGGGFSTFCIKDLTEDSTYTYIHTDIAGAEPSPTFGGTAAIGFFQFPFQASVAGSVSGKDITHCTLPSGDVIPTVAPSTCTASVDDEAPITPPSTTTGLPYFAWIDPGETVFGPEHLRWDESIFSFALKQDEGDPASLTVVVRRPRNEAGNAIGLLGPGRKIWCWFALDCGPDLVKFRGRLVGIPTSIFEELVTLEFVARPIDVVAQKEALAETLRVLPHYDEVMLDKERRNDPEVVLEGYSKIWHYDRETHVLTVSDEITGEDGLVEFDGASEAGKVLYDGLGLTLTSGPLARVDVVAEFSWTQGARGTVDLTDYLVSHWDSSGDAQRNSIASYTFGADSWPKNGTGLGDGWEVAEASAIANYNLEVQTKIDGGTLTVNFGNNETCTATFSDSQNYLAITPPGSIFYAEIVTTQQYSTSASSIGSSYSSIKHLVPMLHTRPTLIAGYTAGRGCVERASFSLFADVQPILTDPEDGEALQITDVRSVNLSEMIGEGSDAYMPIGDPRRRSYIATERGNRSVEHLIALARAHLLKRARVVEIAFAPKLERMPEITLRKNALLIEPRLGEALGKVIGYSISLDGSDGRINCEVRIGCAIGRGGSAVAAGGLPTYCSIDYTGADYQQFTGRTVLFDSSVGYQPPNATPNDDGLEFLSVIRAEDVIDIPLVVENPPQTQFDYVVTQTASWLNFYGVDYFRSDEDVAASVEARVEHINNALKQVPTRATFKLKSMTRDFSSDYEIGVSDLKIPTGYNLETA